MSAAFPSSIAAAARAVVAAKDPDEKVRLAGTVARAWGEGKLALESEAIPMPDEPGRPAAPELLPPTKMPKRSTRGKAGRIAMLHAVAHIEFNAINLAWDLVARFGPESGDRDLVDDWVRVGAEEAVHFQMIRTRLQALGADYGDLPAHDGLWEAAENTADDLFARLAIVPLVLEARGLDIGPQMAARFRKAGDEESARLLDRIYEDEIGHVAAGVRAFTNACARTGQDPQSTYRAIVQKRFKGGLKPPFNEAGRSKAGLLPGFYQDLPLQERD